MEGHISFLPRTSSKARERSGVRARMRLPGSHYVWCCTLRKQLF